MVSQAQVRVGVKGGANLSFLIFDPDIQLDNLVRPGFHLGGFAHYAFADNFGIQGELIFSTQGGRFEGQIFQDGFTFDAEITNKFNYLAVPIIFKYTANSGVTLETGPSLNFLLNAEITSELRGGGQNVSTDVDFNDSLSGLDLNWVFGAGYELPSGLSFNARYSFSVSNAYDEDVVDPAIEEFFNAVFQIGVGFPLYGN